MKSNHPSNPQELEVDHDSFALAYVALTEQQQAACGDLREKGLELAGLMTAFGKEGRELNQAIVKLEEALCWAVSSITKHN